MNLQSLIVVILRLIALNFLLQVAIYLSPQLFQFSEIFHNTEYSEFDSFLTIPIIMISGLIIGAVLIWVFAAAVARFVTRGVAQDISFGSVSLADCYSIAFLGIGLFYITGHFPQVLNWTHYVFKLAATDPGHTWKEEVDWYGFWSAIIPFIVGAILFVKGRFWAVKLAQLQIQNEISKPVDGGQPIQPPRD